MRTPTKTLKKKTVSPSPSNPSKTNQDEVKSITRKYIRLQSNILSEIVPLEMTHLFITSIAENKPDRTEIILSTYELDTIAHTIFVCIANIQRVIDFD